MSLYVDAGYVEAGYYQTGVNADWPNHTFHVPRDSMTLVQSTPVEIRECNLNWLRLQIMGLEDNLEGMTFPTVFTHYPEVDIGSLTLGKSILMREPYTVTFEDGQYAVNLVGANSNIGDRVNVNQVSIRSANSAGLVSSPDIEYGSFNGAVNLCVMDGVNGTTFPTGTPRQPVDNWSDALLIADFRGFSTITFRHHITLSSTADLTGFKIVGTNAIRSSLTIDPAANIANCEITDTTLMGTLDGNTLVRDCVVNGVDFFNGILYQCALTSPTVTLGGGSLVTAMMLDCYSAVAGGNDRPTIDFDNTETNFAVRGWQGGLELVNKTTSAGEVSIDISSGTLYIRSSCTAGEITVRGNGRLVDESGAGCTVRFEGLIDADYVQQLTFEDAIHFDSASGNTGTVYPVGTPRYPVNNIGDALQIAGLRGLSKLNFTGDVLFSTNDGANSFPAFSKGHVAGETHTSSQATVSNVIFTETTFEECKVTGTFGVGSDVSFRSCVLTNVGGCIYDAHDTTLNGTISFDTGTGRSYFGECTTGDTDGAETIIDLAGSDQHLVFHNFSGKIRIVNATTAGLIHSINMVAGKVTIDASCTQGTFKIRGVGELKDETNATVGLDYDLIDPTIIQESAFNGAITFDSVNGVGVDELLAGSYQRPVNTIVGAAQLASTKNFSTIRLQSDVTFSAVASGTFDGITFIGQGAETTTATFNTGNMLGVVFKDCSVTGTADATEFHAHLDNCHIVDFNEFCGHAKNTVFFGTITLNENTGDTNFYSCYDGIPGAGVPDIQVQTCTSLGIWDWQGGIRISNMVTPGTVVSAMITAGRLWVEDGTNTQGDIIVKGLANLVGPTAGTTIDDDGLITKDTIDKFIWDAAVADHTTAGTFGNDLATVSDVASQVSLYNIPKSYQEDAAYGEYITVDSAYGYTANLFPYGTPKYPYGNVASALTAASSRNIKKFKVYGNHSLSGTEYLSNKEWIGESKSRGIYFTNGSASTSAATFRNMYINNNVNGAPYCYDVFVNAVYVTGGNYLNCEMHSWLRLSSGSSALFVKCYESPAASFIFEPNTSSDWAFIAYYGDMIIRNMNQAYNSTGNVINLAGGTVTIENTCTRGAITITGHGTVIDNSGASCTVTIDTTTDKLIAMQQTLTALDTAVSNLDSVTLPTTETTRDSYQLVAGDIVSGTDADTLVADGTEFVIDGSTGIHDLNFTFTIPANFSEPVYLNLTGYFETTDFSSILVYYWDGEGWTYIQTLMYGRSTPFDYQMALTGFVLNSNVIQIRLLAGGEDLNANNILHIDRIWISAKGEFTTDSIADAVWDEAVADHITAGTYGLTPTLTADEVWNSTLSGHSASATFGGELATKADINKSVATDYEAPANGILISGTNTSGNYLSTLIRDGSSWVITEHATNGIEVRFTFNLPSADHKPALFEVYGNYTGFPSTTHHQELWAYNYEAGAYELLSDEFLPGGNTTASTFQHEYYERHVDRTNNNEVRLKILHHTATYNASHTLTLDYVGLSSVKLTTATDIADAVWTYDPEVDTPAWDRVKNTEADVAIARKASTNKAVISPDDLTVTVYDDDGVTILYQFDITADKRIRTPQ